MNCGKTQQELDDLITGELQPSERLELEEHLLACAECRSYAAWSRDLAARASALPQSIEPSRDVWPEISSRLSTLPARKAPVIHLATRGVVVSPANAKPAAGKKGLNRPIAIAAALFVLIALSSLLTFNARQPGAEQLSWTVTDLAGAPMIGARLASQGGSLRVGESLETDATSRAQIEVGNIGQVELRPNSRLRVLESAAHEQRLALDKGSMSAMILAPPRLFFVETPSALAVDLGCAYELTVDSHGNGHLAVTVGWVSLEFSGRQSLVPAEAACVSRPGLGPGTPYFLDSSKEFQRALTAVDLNRSLDTSLTELLANSRVRDTLSLWHLLSRVSRDRREMLWDRLNELVPAPAGVTREGVLKLNQTMLERWKDDLEQFWF